MKRIYTNGEIDRAGQNLARNNINSSTITDDLKIISEWRDSHLFGLNKLSNIVNKRSNQVGGNNVIVSRLKKLESIKLKLFLNPDTKLSRMQDIGGCRIIVDNMKKLKAITSRMSNFHGGFKLLKVNNYIDKPKSSGYRCVHLIYELIDNDNNNYKILLELQCRTITQHLWSTAVETVGLFNKMSLKSGQGDEYWIEFFKYVSMLFEYDEIKKIHDNKIEIKDLIKTLINHNKKYNCIQKINNYRIFKDVILNNNQNYDYYLLVLDYIKRQISVYGFLDNQSEEAQKKYMEFESKSDANINAVLVSAESIKEVNDGYPNYFADTGKFINKYNELIRKYQ